MFRAILKDTGEQVTVYAVVNCLALIYKDVWLWIGLEDIVPAEGIQG